MKANDGRMLVQRHYYTDKNGMNRVTGVFVGFYDEVAEKVRTGFSRVNYSSGDKFNMEIGLSMAISQAVLPHQFLKDNEENQYFWDNYVAFIDRATRYFRQGLGDVPVNQRPKRSYPKKISNHHSEAFDIMTEMMRMTPIGFGMADLKGLNKVRKMNIPTGGIVTTADYQEADLLLGKIAHMFKRATYPKRHQILRGLLELCIADEEGIALLKKHFPDLDFSKVKVAKKV